MGIIVNTSNIEKLNNKLDIEYVSSLGDEIVKYEFNDMSPNEFFNPTEEFKDGLSYNSTGDSRAVNFSYLEAEEKGYFSCTGSKLSNGANQYGYCILRFKDEIKKPWTKKIKIEFDLSLLIKTDSLQGLRCWSLVLGEHSLNRQQNNYQEQRNPYPNKSYITGFGQIDPKEGVDYYTAPNNATQIFTTVIPSNNDTFHLSYELDLINKKVKGSINYLNIDNQSLEEYVLEEQDYDKDIDFNCLCFQTYGNQIDVYLDNISITTDDNPQENIIYVLANDDNQTGNMYTYHNNHFYLLGEDRSVLDHIIKGATIISADFSTTDSIEEDSLVITFKDTDENGFDTITTVNYPLSKIDINLDNYLLKDQFANTSQNGIIYPLSKDDDNNSNSGITNNKVFKVNIGEGLKIKDNNIVIDDSKVITVDNLSDNTIDIQNNITNIEKRLSKTEINLYYDGEDVVPTSDEYFNFTEITDENNNIIGYGIQLNPEKELLSKYVIPYSYNYKPIKNIGDECFSQRGQSANITNVIIPSTVTRIGGNCFSNTGITKIKIPNSVSIIAGYAFSNCSKLEEIVIGEQVSKIPSSCFGECVALKKVIVKSKNYSDNYVGDYCFEGISSLDNLTIYLYDYNKDLKQKFLDNGIKNFIIDIPHSHDNKEFLDTLNEENTFGEIDDLKTQIINLKHSMELFSSYENVSELSGYPVETYSSLEEWFDYNYLKETSDQVNVCTIKATNSLKELTGTQFIKIPAFTINPNNNHIYQVIGIEAEGFSNENKSYKATQMEFILPNTIKLIGEKAFMGQTLTSICIPNKVVQIDTNAFQDCINLTTIKLSNSIAPSNGLGRDIFYNSDGSISLKNIYFNGTSSEWNNIIKKYPEAFPKDLAGITINYLKDYIPKGLISMWSGAIKDIPTGWALCDGSNGTPDLRGRFIIGYSNTLNENNTIYEYDVAETGGKNLIPSHEHELSHILSVNASAKGNIVTTYIQQAGNQKAYSEGILKVAATQEVAFKDTLPPYYALAYIMKIN